LVLNSQDVAQYGEVGAANLQSGANDHVQMIVRGGQNDTVELKDNINGAWQYEGLVSLHGVGFHVYNHGNTQLLIESQVHLIP
jgi:hypothetical protein